VSAARVAEARGDAELTQKAAEAARKLVVRTQTLAATAERLFTAILGMREEGMDVDVPALTTVATQLGNVSRMSDQALREAMESTDRLLDALGADAGARVLERGRLNAGTSAREGVARTREDR
jgi:hypothetical protein